MRSPYLRISFAAFAFSALRSSVNSDIALRFSVIKKATCQVAKYINKLAEFNSLTLQFLQYS